MTRLEWWFREITVACVRTRSAGQVWQRGDLPGGSRLLVLYSWSLSHPWEFALDTPVEGHSLDADLP